MSRERSRLCPSNEDGFLTDEATDGSRVTAPYHFQARNAISILSAFENLRHTGSRNSPAVLRRIRNIRLVQRRTASRAPKS